MGLPGWGTAVGVIAKIVDRFTDPVTRKNNRLKELDSMRDNLLASGVSSPSSKKEMQRILDEIATVRRDLDSLRS